MVTRVNRPDKSVPVEDGTSLTDDDFDCDYDAPKYTLTSINIEAKEVLFPSKDNFDIRCAVSSLMFVSIEASKGLGHGPLKCSRCKPSNYVASNPKSRACPSSNKFLKNACVTISVLLALKFCSNYIVPKMVQQRNTSIHLALYEMFSKSNVSG